MNDSPDVMVSYQSSTRLVPFCCLYRSVCEWENSSPDLHELKLQYYWLADLNK